MKSSDWQHWSSANQAYLSAALGFLQERLQWHADTTSAGNAAPSPQDWSTQELSLRALSDDMPALPAIEQLAQVFGLSQFEKDILLLCAGVALDAAFAGTVAEISGSASPTFGLALAALQGAHWSALSPVSALRYWQLIGMQPSPIITRATLHIDEQILHFLTGIRQMNERLIDLVTQASLTQDPVPSQQRLAASVLQAINSAEQGVPPVIQLSEASSSDKQVIATYVSRRLERRLFVMSAFAIPAATKEISTLAKLWSREAALNNYILAIDCEELDLSDKARLQSVSFFMEQVQGILLLYADYWTPLLRRGRLSYAIKKPMADEQLALWEASLARRAGKHDSLLRRLTSQFNLSSEAIREITAGVTDDSEDLPQHLWRECCRKTRPQVDELAQRIEPVATWDDIVLPEAQIGTLREIAAQVRQRNKVYSEWGFGAKSARGLGISALFAGESGTGKTMASEVLANELNLDLYKIDLSKVVNKYIGETEKNLRKIFDAAEDGGAILLFDEADALFGKRSDVKDSHDRYSNIEVSYLLQRMEAYRGLAILTTNMKGALDKAFLRRIRFVINFPFPDAGQRADIWQRIFPAAMPKDGLDYERLSKFTIPGGNIRNIAMNAAFSAAEADRPVQMSHILRAAKQEYDKIEKPLNNMEAKAWQ